CSPSTVGPPALLRFPYTTLFRSHQRQRFIIKLVQLRVQTVYAHLQTTQGFLQRLLEGTANRHHLTDGFHLSGQTIIGLREFFERSEEHTSELQSRENLVCRLLLE